MAQFDRSEALSEVLSETIVVQPAPSVSSQRESFLHFYLKEGVSALLPLQYSTEALSISRKDIVPLFFMPAWVAGVYNLRGEILWIVDLADLLGLTPSYEQVPRLNFTVLVVQVTQSPSTPGRTQILGCIVHDLESIEYCDFCDIQPLSVRHAIPPAFLQGYWTKSDSETLAVLDMKAILQSLSSIN